VSGSSSRVSSPLLRRGSLLMLVAALIAGLFGMHVISGSHGEHSATPIATDTITLHGQVTSHHVHVTSKPLPAGHPASRTVHVRKLFLHRGRRCHLHTVAKNRFLGCAAPSQRGYLHSHCHRVPRSIATLVLPTRPAHARATQHQQDVSTGRGRQHAGPSPHPGPLWLRAPNCLPLAADDGAA
jgi:hypothetical protein